MSRRRAVVLISAGVIFALGALVVLAVGMTTRTAWGREQIRSYVAGFLNRNDRAKWHLGTLSGSLFTDLTVDSFAIREPNDSLFISTGPVSVRFSPRDLWDRRILVQAVNIEHPVVHVRQDSLGKWNYRKIFPSGPPGPPKTTRSFGDFIVVTNATMRDGEFHLTMPWRPADSLKATRRDSAITFGLNRKDKDIRRVGTSGQFVMTRHWTKGRATIPYARIAHPDTAGRFFDVAGLGADEFDPPMQIANARGTVKIVKDSLWADFAHFELPGSRGRAEGKVWWGSDLPTRYDLLIHGDSVAMKDVAWVYPTLPTTGGGTMDLRVRNQKDLKILDYALSEMDVRTVGSRLRGAMTFGVGGPVLIVKDVDMKAEPIDWELIEDLTGEPLPYPWKGTITAEVKASGGPVNAFRIEQSSFDMVDGNVRGATARGRARGELDILFPAFTKFKGFDVEVDHFDLATIQFLNPLFPRLDGSINGKATLDSVWTDVRFRNADMTHRFMDEPPSRATGAGRVTIGEKLLTYDVALDAQPLELTTIAKAWPELLLQQRGTLTGPVRLQGTAEDLEVATQMSGAQGIYGFDGRVDIDSVGGYGYHGTLRFANANLRALYDTVSMPVTSLNGTALLDLVGDSVLNYRGSVALDLQRSTIDSTRVYDGALARLRFLDGALKVDTVIVETVAGSVIGQGGLGLRPEFRDSLTLRLSADSLGGWRPYFRRLAVDSVALAAVEEDSLHGALTGFVVLSGSIDTLGVRGVVDATDVDAYATAAKRGRFKIDVANVLSDSARGVASVTADSLRLSTIAFKNGAFDAQVRRSDSLDVQMRAEMTNGPMLTASGGVGIAGDTTRVTMREARVGLDTHDWKLARPSRITWWPQGFLVDSLRLVGSSGGHMDLTGGADSATGVALRISGDSLALEDLASLAQSKVALSGSLGVTVDMRGDRENPELDLRGSLLGTKVGQVTLAETAINGAVRNRRFLGGLQVMRNDTTVLSLRASVPVDVAVGSRSRRLLDDTLRVTVQSRDVDLKLVESFTPAISDASGRLNADMSISGKRGSEVLAGYVRVDSAGGFVTNLGVKVRDFNANLRASGDTVHIDRFGMVSGPTTANRLSLGGFVSFDTPDDPAFDLRLDAREFHVIDLRRTGDLNVSAGLRFRGRESTSELTGSVTVDNGYIVIPELSSKEVVSLNDPDFASIVDTTLAANRALLPRLPRLLQGLTVRDVGIAMGPDVRLRSSEANIKLGGSVSLRRASGLTASGVPQLAVDGALRTERGTFNIRFSDFLQRLFTIEGGEIRFYDEADFNPTLNISTLYTVRQRNQLYSNNTIRIRARLAGTLVQPRLVFESADSLQLSDSDLIAYLLTGRPSADIGGLSTSYARDFLLTTVGSSISARFSGQFFDYFQLQAASGGAEQTNQALSSTLFDALFTTQIGVGKQLNDRTFINLTTGLCPLQQFTGGGVAGTTTIRAADTIGGSIEYTIRSGLGVSVSREPPLAAMLCNENAIGFAANRGAQWSLDLFRTWRW